MMSEFQSDQESISIKYTFEFQDGHCESHEVLLNSDTIELQEDLSAGSAEWTRLENNQCPICQLTAQQSEYCPAAVAISNLSTHFGHRDSFTPVTVQVETAHRTITSETPLQSGLFSLLGLRMATSGCPVLSKLRPMARFHLPFADSEETGYRAIAMYLVSQFLRQSKGLPADFSLDELRQIYQNVHQVNMAFCKRITDTDSSDANINSLTTLDMFAQDVPFSIESALDPSG